MMTYLVTGGAGFIGSSIAQALLQAGERVRIIDDFSTGRWENIDSLPGRVELIEGSILDPALVDQAMSGVEVVFHQAAVPSVAFSVNHPVQSLRVGVEGTVVLLESARCKGVRRFIFAGSSSVYGNTPVLPKLETMSPLPLSPYAVSKLTCEHLLMVFSGLYGLETVTLRYFNVFGPRQNPAGEYAAVIARFITAILEGKRPIIYGDGEQTRDFCFIENVVDANLLAASTSRKLSGEVVNIACGQRVSLNDLVVMLQEEATACGWLSCLLSPEYQPPRAGDVRDSLADLRTARELIGYTPRVYLREGLRMNLEAFHALRENASAPTR
ncbi:SDR family oxidoreductase [Pajaroellobacter abortibovis]|uniref:Vi polysaccharide biosynthesis protein VipB/TviC n=1 Tax=Pajaroellobacter abortibovis TaxID=1882918 RepID=A0A1L6MW18_9BACT|nr:SDR family oxidoreductase [Pajaroellobacter abortibovis]APR99743.1 Vi polysaccharide biosynthesis protein VipB/TviC [Pajaroellobacter abortibovis]